MKPRTDAEFLIVSRNGPCFNENHLHTWINRFCGINVPRTAVCPHHSAPFEYLRRAYFEPTRDLIVWAPRGGAKTRLGAVATLLDLLHKPGVAVRILGGSLEQSMKMWEHLLPDLESAAGDLLVAPARSGRRLSLTNGSTAAILTQSQRAVRGLRVQKVRCDEVELFDTNVWEAAQLATRTRVLDGKPITGAIEAISTFHKPYGLMNRIIENAQKPEPGPKPVMIQWCLLEVLEKCPPERQCNGCLLWDDCQGIAKTKCNGFFPIEDAIVMKHRVSVESWNSEILCRRPSAQGCVFPAFDPDVHVRPWGGSTSASVHLAMDFGYRAPFVCLWIASGEDGTVHVIDEYIQPQRTLEEHLEHLKTRQWPAVRWVACDPAGRSRNEQTAESNIAILRRFGYSVRSRASSIVDGLERIRRALKPAAGPVSLFIDPRCSGLIRSMRSYHYAPNGGSELPLKDGEHDHAIDALRYFFANRESGGKVVSRRY